MQAERVLCLTATVSLVYLLLRVSISQDFLDALQATPKVAEDICSAFDIDRQGVFRTTTHRSNLCLLAKSFKTGEEKMPDLKNFLRQHQGPSIVYVQTHNQTDTVCQSLKKDNFNAHGYHAGMSNDDRTAVQDKFMKSEDIIVSGLNHVTAPREMLMSGYLDRGHNRFRNGHRQG